MAEKGDLVVRFAFDPRFNFCLAGHGPHSPNVSPPPCHFGQNQRHQACFLKVSIPTVHSESQGIKSEVQELGRSSVLKIREFSVLLFIPLNVDAGNVGKRTVREKILFGFRGVCRYVIGNLM